jgi:transcriptional regulator with XRE-family HTH domain
MEALHERLARTRKAKGLTAKAVAQAIGEAESTYRGWESGRGRKLPPFEKLSEVLSISVTELVVGQPADLGEVLQTLTVIEGELRRLRLKIGSRI